MDTSIFRIGITLLAITSVVSCRQQLTNAEKLRTLLEAAPPLAPLANDDISDPQGGYYHQTVAITGGDYIHIKPGDSRLKEPDPSRSLKFVPINFFSDEQAELFSGFTPGMSFCDYGSKVKDQWVCLIFASGEDAKAYIKNESEIYTVPFVACLNCKPKPMVALSRICPGIYISYLDPSDNWEDPTRPGPKFNKEGNCYFDKPWWQTEEGIRMGLEKHSQFFN